MYLKKSKDINYQKPVKTKKTFFRASSAPVWQHCKGSLTLEDDEFSSVYAEMGKKRHDFAADHLISRLKKEKQKPIELEKDDIKLINDYTEFCISRIKRSKTFFYGCEFEVSSNLASWLLRGFVDFACYDGKTLTIIDLKSGFSKMDEDHLIQLKIYAYLIMDCFQILPEKFDLFLFTRFQIVDGSYTLREILDDKNELTNSMNKDGFDFKVGSHCKKCFKIAKCDLAKSFVSDVVLTKETPTVEKLLLFEPIFKQKMEEVKAKLVLDFIKGRDTPKGVYFKHGNRFKYWMDEYELKEKYGDKIVTKKTMSPAQAMREKVDTKEELEKLYAFTEPKIIPTTTKPKKEVERTTYKDLMDEELKKLT